MDLLLEATRRAEREHFWFKGFRAFVAPVVARAAAAHPPVRLLDCGCGTGVNLPMLAAHGKAYGFDLTWTGLKFAKDHGEQRLAQASVVAVPFRDGAFDLVTCFDVLQCLAPDAGRMVLREFNRILAPGGQLVMNVAALELLRGDHAVLAEEVHRYERGELHAMVEAAGFHVARMTFTNASLFPVMFGTRWWQRRRGLKPADQAQDEITIPAAPVNHALTALLACEAALVRRLDMPIGSSLLVLAQKR
ncbi:MAG: class I SAM-dependent methyltransferase [Acidobacteria bacterium]|nr:class I SAM-dependent methyltransferase [Acidobacteriota bacterium]